VTVDSLEETIDEARRLADRSRNPRLKELLHSIANDLERLVEEARRVEPGSSQT
jgi:hypothetical protein